jgi:hypothetical protein
MSIAVEPEAIRRRGATTEHPSKWGCEEGATKSSDYFCFNSPGLRISWLGALSLLGRRSKRDKLPRRYTLEPKIFLSGDAHGFSRACSSHRFST